MSTYSLSGTGVQALSAGVTAVHVTISTLPTSAGNGTANPTNHYHVGMLRFGDAIGYFDAVPVVGGPQWLAVPAGTTRCGYSLSAGAAISFAEVIGGSRPFGGADALSSLSDVALASPADAQVLTYQASSAKWVNAAASGGGGGTRFSSQQTLAAVAATVTFSSIPAGHGTLRLVALARSDQSASQGIRIRFNGDSGANYNNTWIFSQGGTLTNTEARNTTSGFLGDCTGAGISAGAAGPMECSIPLYDYTSLHKGLLARSVQFTPSNTFYNFLSVGHWSSLAAITSITLFPASGNFAIGSTFLLYGDL